MATDPLSLLFIGCFLFGLLFLLVTTLLGNLGHSGQGGLGHDVDVGHHAGHIGPHHVGSIQGKGLSVGHGAGHADSHAHTTHSPKGAAQSLQGNDFLLLTYVNPTSIVLFLLGFGFFGYVFHNTAALAFPLTLVLAGVSGFIVAALILTMLNRLFGDSEGATVQDVSDRTGLLGKVSVTIQENGLGEILYISPGGMRKSIAARSVNGRRLERDQEVVVVNYQHGVAEVDTWDHFVNQESAEMGDASAIPDADELARLRALLEEPTRADTEFVMRKDMQKE
ncbi:MAG TPA: hypothetical protein VFA10_20220 [Ktedonobacteraceae bacterium]|nr:hypothetical protein [Ktedonobacteraceae bacterium]